MGSGRRRSPLPPGWATTRRRILARDPTCTLCHSASSTEVDHALAHDDHRDEALRGVCSPCHLTRTGRQGAEVTNARHAARRRPPEPHPGLIAHSE
ncbi:HNH endonuclease [Parafrankia sp. FMc2]|uniref:HNH endonuclease n=1 Tax=Parafrankia sp. FMc2 TaxID=3233196 RepID=UPI0034D51503